MFYIYKVTECNHTEEPVFFAYMSDAENYAKTCSSTAHISPIPVLSAREPVSNLIQDTALRKLTTEEIDALGLKYPTIDSPTILQPITSQTAEHVTGFLGQGRKL